MGLEGELNDYLTEEDEVLKASVLIALNKEFVTDQEKNFLKEMSEKEANQNLEDFIFLEGDFAGYIKSFLDYINE